MVVETEVGVKVGRGGACLHAPSSRSGSSSSVRAAIMKARSMVSLATCEGRRGEPGAARVSECARAVRSSAPPPP